MIYRPVREVIFIEDKKVNRFKGKFEFPRWQNITTIAYRLVFNYVRGRSYIWGVLKNFGAAGAERGVRKTLGAECPTGGGGVKILRRRREKFGLFP